MRPDQAEPTAGSPAGDAVAGGVNAVIVALMTAAVVPVMMTGGSCPRPGSAGRQGFVHLIV